MTNKYIFLTCLIFSLTINYVSSVKCGIGAVSANSQNFKFEIYFDGFDVKVASYSGGACKFINPETGDIQYYTDKPITVLKYDRTNKWVDGEIKFISTGKEDAFVRYFIHSNKRRIWTTKQKMICPEGAETKEGVMVNMIVLTNRYGTAGKYEGLACKTIDIETGGEIWYLKDEMSIYDQDAKDRFSRGDLSFTNPSRKLENIQVFMSSDKKTVKTK